MKNQTEQEVLGKLPRSLRGKMSCLFSVYSEYSVVLHVRIITSLLLTGVFLACFGCANAQRSSRWEPTGWEDPEYARPSAPSAMEAATRAPQRQFTSDASEGQDAAGAYASAMVQPAQPGAVALSTSLVSLREWCRALGLPAPVAIDAALSGFVIRHVSGVLRLTVGSTVANWKGMELHLGYAPVLIEGQVFVQSADIRSTLAPLLSRQTIPAFSGSIIVLDPGHGGTDSGTRSIYGANEKDFTLDWAKRLQVLLAADGWRVYLTRASDSEVSLSNRVAFAESLGASLFLSLHFNSAPPDKSGIETYCLTPAGVPSTLTRGFSDELDLILPNNEFDDKNLQLAVLIHRALLDVNGGRDRGIRRARFPAVLRGQRRPAVLIEGGFLSNPTEARLIATPAHRQRLAEAVALALRPVAPRQAGR
jgi:N-acetylmuramoyl-L-alanine amidase